MCEGLWQHESIILQVTINVQVGAMLWPSRVQLPAPSRRSGPSTWPRCS